MNHRARKRFGQHFLTAPEVIEEIVAAIDPRDDDVIVEIGPGQAAITDPLSVLAPTLHAIEFDRVAGGGFDFFQLEGFTLSHAVLLATALDYCVHIVLRSISLLAVVITLSRRGQSQA